MITAQARAHRSPGYLGWFNPVVVWMLKAGLSLGPNALLTVRGRKSGVERTVPVAVLEVGGRRWLSSPYGEVQWVRNLRAAREGVIRKGRQATAYRAIELSTEEAATFFRDTMAPYVRSLPIGRWLIGSMLGAPEMLDDPEQAARSHPVFELLPQA